MSEGLNTRLSNLEKSLNQLMKRMSVQEVEDDDHVTYTHETIAELANTKNQLIQDELKGLYKSMLDELDGSMLQNVPRFVAHVCSFVEKNQGQYAAIMGVKRNGLLKAKIALTLIRMTDDKIRAIDEYSDTELKQLIEVYCSIGKGNYDLNEPLIQTLRQASSPASTSSGKRKGGTMRAISRYLGTGDKR